jgi:hypothetical protein
MSIRIALDLDGSLESLTNSMGELAHALDERDDCSLVPFVAEPDRRFLVNALCADAASSGLFGDALSAPALIVSWAVLTWCTLPVRSRRQRSRCH